MTAASGPRNVQIQSGDVVLVRQVRPDDAPALASAYANLGEQSRYRRFFTAMPELPDHTLKAAVEVEVENHEALVARTEEPLSGRWASRVMLGGMPVG
jgi:acetyltransferase